MPLVSIATYSLPLVHHSLSTRPLASVLAKKSAKLVIINHQDTDLDPVADLVIQEGIGGSVIARRGPVATFEQGG